MTELTPEQWRELTHGEPTVLDPRTGQAYVLVRKELYDRMKGRILSSDEQWAEDAYQEALERFARDGWDDPRMDVYDRLDPRRRP